MSGNERITSSSLDSLVTVQILGVALDTDGAPIQDGANVLESYECWADRQAGPAMQVTESGTTEMPAIMVDFLMRYLDNVKLKAKDRIVYDGQAYEVVGPPVEIGRRDFLKVRTKLINGEVA